MKHLHASTKVVFLLFPLLAAVALGSCRFPVFERAPSPVPAGTLRLSWRLPSARTLLPATGGVISTYDVILTRTGFADITRDGISAASSDVAIDSISAGTWHVTVSARSSSSALAARGETDVVIADAGPNAATVTLRYLSSGSGDLSITVSWPSAQGVDTVDLEVIKPDSSRESSQPAVLGGDHCIYSRTSTAWGTYILIFKLSRTGLLVGAVQEAAQVFGSLSTAATINLAAADFKSAPAAPPSLSAAQEMEGIRLTWDAGAILTASEFLIQRKLAAEATYGDYATVGGIVDTYWDGAVDSRSTYVYRVAARNTFGASAWVTSSSVMPIILVATPTFAPPDGEYESADLTISCATPGAVIHYTLDGTTPDGASPVYGTPIALAHAPAVRAVATRTGMDDSLVAAGSYVINPFKSYHRLYEGIAASAEFSCSYIHNGILYIGAGYSGLNLYSLSNPASPQLVANVPMQYQATDCVAAGSYAFVHDGWYGLKTIDVSSPAGAAVVQTTSAANGGSGMAISGTTLVLDNAFNGVQVADISDPLNPVIRTQISCSYGVSDVAASGSYAYMADGLSGIQVIDISSPSTAAIVRNVAVGYAWKLALNGTYLYVASSYGIKVVDISTPTAASQVGSISVNGWVSGLFVDNGKLYVATSESYVADPIVGLSIYSLASPAAPSFISSVSDAAGTPVSVSVAGNYAYVADTSSLKVVDISGGAPSVVKTLPTNGASRDVAVDGPCVYIANEKSGLKIANTAYLYNGVMSEKDTPGHAVAVAARDYYVYLCDEMGGFHIFDNTSSFHFSPTLALTLPMDDCQDVALWQDYAFVADGGSGLHIVDISTPVAASVVTTVDTPGGAGGVDVDGEYAYVADYNSGLTIVDISPVETAACIKTIPIPDYAVDVAVKDHYAYVLAVMGGLVVLDLSDPLNPVTVRTISGVESWGKLKLFGDYLFIASSYYGVNIVDISTPASAFIVENLPMPTAYGVYWNGTMLFCADEQEGVVVFGK